MKLHFLGTGAADWDISRANDSCDFRRNSSMLIAGTLLVDPGACIFEFESTYGYSGLYAGVTDIVCSHKHGDHYNPETVRRLEEQGAVFHDLAAGDVLETDGYIIRAFEANHRTAKAPMHLVIESKADGKRIFYGCDGAWMFYETYRALFALEHFDLMIFDCTIGDIHGDYRIFEHNNVAMIAEMRELFRKICPRFVASHLARTLHPATHAETAAVLEKYGFETAYDNAVLEV